MERSKVLAMFREFPFLERHYVERRVQNVRVQRADNELLDVIPDADGNDYYGYVVPEPVHILDRAGNCIRRVGFRERQKITWRNLWTRSWMAVEWTERVRDALASLSTDDLRRAYYIVRGQRDCVKGYTVTIYKPPESAESMLDLVTAAEAEIEDFRRTIQAENA